MNTTKISVIVFGFFALAAVYLGETRKEIFGLLNWGFLILLAPFVLSKIRER
jgi:hypothetical protein